MKKFLLSSALILALSSANAQYLNGIAATVNNEPITDYDVELVIKALKISPNEALNVLIREKLEDASIKELGINVPESELFARLTAIAQQNGYSDYASFVQVANSKGVDVAAIQDKAKKDLAKAKLYEYIVSQPNENINRENAMRFYEQNRGIFTRFSSAKVIKYTASSGARLEELKNINFIAAGTTSTNMTIYPDRADPRVLNLIASTAEGDFTPIFNEGAGYATFKVIKKENPELVSFEEVEGSVATMMVEQEREALVADYFNKQRARANIEIIKR